jgi:hypothetical protein
MLSIYITILASPLMLVELAVIVTVPDAREGTETEILETVPVWALAGA